MPKPQKHHVMGDLLGKFKQQGLISEEFDKMTIKLASPETTRRVLFYLREMEKPVAIRKSEAEIRKKSRVLYQGKNSRVLYQAGMQQTLFKKLPDFLCMEIAGLTGNRAVHNEKTATEIAIENFERPKGFF